MKLKLAMVKWKDGPIIICTQTKCILKYEEVLKAMFSFGRLKIPKFDQH